MSRVLVVEDDEDVRFLVQVSLRLGGHECTEASSLEAARARLDGVELVLLDLSLPDGDAVAFAHELGRQGRPFLLVSARRETELERLAAATGARGYLLKPFAPAHLAAAVQSALTGG